MKPDAEAKPARQKWPQIAVCVICGGPFEKTKSKKKNKTCGASDCYRALIGPRISLALKGREITPEWRVKISATLSAKNLKGSEHPNWKGPISKVCSWCRETYWVKRFLFKKSLFCSHKCHNHWRRSVSPLGKSEKEKALIQRRYHDRSFHVVADQIRQRDGYTCRSCGKYQINPKLDVHHIRRARLFPIPADAHMPANLISLCHRCHYLVERGKMPCPSIPT